MLYALVNDLDKSTVPVRNMLQSLTDNIQENINLLPDWPAQVTEDEHEVNLMVLRYSN